MSGARSIDAATPIPITVAVLTYRRPDAIAALVPVLLDQARTAMSGRGEPLLVRVLVIDNEPGAPARDLVRSAGADYVSEPRPGIAAARNRALAECAGDDALVFIDDDEFPMTGWLSALVGLWLAMRDSTWLAAVTGPVVPCFAIPPSPWLAAGRFYGTGRKPTGTRQRAAATNNILLDMACVRLVGVKFDERFGLSGGEDTLLTRQLTASGAAIMWCDEAAVQSVVPAERLTARWALMRSFSTGNADARSAVELAPARLRQLAGRVRYSAIGGLRVLLGGARSLAGLAFRSPRHRARGARTAFRGAGMVAGSASIGYQQYRRRHAFGADRYDRSG